MRLIHSFLLCVLVCSWLGLPTFARSFKDNKGRSFDAEVIGWNDDVVELKQGNKTRRVAMTRFSPNDQGWVQQNIRKNLALALPVGLRTYTTDDGKTFEAELRGLRGSFVEFVGKNDTLVQIALDRLSAKDEIFIVAKAPMLGTLNANPEVRHPPKKIEEAIDTLDALMAKHHRSEGTKLNPVVDDATFVRRSYLNIIGRVPTADETRAFLSDVSDDKRVALIDALYETDGYVHHAFNYWADLLRIRHKNSNRNYGGSYYVQWIKDAVRENMPFDEMVQDMLSAEGYYWENPAVGFYRRDLGMPLDNLAVMCQTLLGTSIVCAQCHDHPFDTWTQKEYYEMAAYTYPMVTKLNTKEVPVVKGVGQIIRDKVGKEKRAMREFGQENKRARQRLIDYPLASGSQWSDRRLKYPKDYAYDDAKPNGVVTPDTPFGDVADAGPLKQQRIAPFVDWFTSPENPRFARNIANRLWKEVFGLGLVEPVDDLKSDATPFAPEVMAYCEELLVDLNFDLKTYRRILTRSELFQRECYAEPIEAAVDGYPFSGPVIRRLSAEQMWDSIVGLIVPNVDQRINKSLLTADNSMARQALATMEMSPEQLFEEIVSSGDSKKYDRDALMKADLGDNNLVYESGSQPITTKRVRERDSDRFKGLNRQQRRALVLKEREDNLAAQRAKDPWFEYSRDMHRAAELPSPAPGGHFLNMFGQSDRIITENDKQEASIPQALTLMNDSKLLDFMVDRRQSGLRQSLVEAYKPRAMIEEIYLATYSRLPSSRELDMLEKELVVNREQGAKRILWAVLNSQAFRFVE